MRRSSRLPLARAALAATLAGAVLAHAAARAADDPAPPVPPVAPATPAVVAEGAEAPDFTLKDAEGKDVALSSFRGKKTVVLAFFPKAFTKLCTVEMKCFATEWRKLEDRGAVVVAVSGDTSADQKKFCAATGARFPMLSDTGLKVTRTYGVFTPSTDGGYAARSIFLVDREGKVRWIARDFTAPRTLEGTELLAKIDGLKPAAADPADLLATAPSPEKETRTAVIRYVQALLTEDMKALEALLHREFGWKAGHTPSMIQVRRDAEVERIRKLFDTQDLRALAFTDCMDPRDSRTLAKGDQEKAGVMTGYSDEARKAVAELPEGDVLVVARTKAPKAGEVQILARELWVHFRKDGETWKILGTSGR